MRTTIDSAGRLVIPKQLRDELGLEGGSTVDISRYGAGLQLIAGERSAAFIDEDGLPVVTGSTTLTDQQLFAIIDAGRR